MTLNILSIVCLTHTHGCTSLNCVTTKNGILRSSKHLEILDVKLSIGHFNSISRGFIRVFFYVQYSLYRRFLLNNYLYWVICLVDYMLLTMISKFSPHAFPNLNCVTY